MKNKKIIFGILLFLVTISIGYALLSGNINVNSTANVNPIDMDLSLEYGVVPYGDLAFSKTTTETGHSNETISCSDMSCTYSVDFDRPEAVQDFYIQITNNSNFDVKLKQITVTSNYTGEKNNQSDGMVIVYNTKKENLGSHNVANYVLTGTLFNPQSPNLVITEDEICQTGKNCHMSANGGAFTIGIAEQPFADDASNEINYSVTRTMSFEFEQYNRYD